MLPPRSPGRDGRGPPGPVPGFRAQALIHVELRRGQGLRSHRRGEATPVRAGSRVTSLLTAEGTAAGKKPSELLHTWLGELLRTWLGDLDVALQSTRWQRLMPGILRLALPPRLFKLAADSKAALCILGRRSTESHLASSRECLTVFDARAWHLLSMCLTRSALHALGAWGPAALRRVAGWGPPGSSHFFLALPGPNSSNRA